MAEEVVSSVLGSGVVLGATLGVLSFLGRQRNRLQANNQASLCNRCNGTGQQQCQLCYGKGSTAKPGFVNVVDPYNRSACKRCDRLGKHTCNICGGSGLKASQQ
ncbi:hypothetical protein WJX72_010150 [[Myrmecia] bisecta]|uniref:Uncharacterized protein n=1 Tax=[Myrmecia] bisecta TaxID=41462 RepID=A0AAW1R8U8_9CHLO